MQPKKKDIREKKAKSFGFFAFACALAEWWYSVMAPEPDPIFTSLLLFGVFLFVLLAVWEWRAGACLGEDLDCEPVPIASQRWGNRPLVERNALRLPLLAKDARWGTRRRRSVEVRESGFARWTAEDGCPHIL